MSAATMRGLVMAGLLLFWVGLVSIGASGVVAAGMTVAFGTDFVSGDFPWVTYTPDRCAELQEYAPPGATCARAAADHHADETVGYRIDAGVLGLFVLVGWLVLGRSNFGKSAGPLPPGMVGAAGTAMFGVVGLGLLGLGFELLVPPGNHGAGAFLSAGVVSLVTAVPFAARLYRVLAAWDRPAPG